MSQSMQAIAIAQVQQAFGQGTGPMRVGRRAALAIGERTRALVDEPALFGWDTLAPRVLERARAVGRLAASLAAERGATAIAVEDCARAAEVVDARTPAALRPRAVSATGSGDARAEIAAQFHIAFGQGAGALDATAAAVAALDERYASMLADDEMVAHWDSVGVQVLERVRAVGRLAAQRACRAGAIAIERDDFVAATLAVEAASACPYCPLAQLARADARPAAAIA